MVAVGTIALMMVYIREERLLMDRSRFSKIDAMFIYLLGTMSGQGNSS
jgi:hypothetical protein